MTESGDDHWILKWRSPRRRRRIARAEEERKAMEE